MPRSHDEGWHGGLAVREAPSLRRKSLHNLLGGALTRQPPVTSEVTLRLTFTLLQILVSQTSQVRQSRQSSCPRRFVAAVDALLAYLLTYAYLLGMTQRMGESWDELYGALCWIGYAPLKGRWRIQSLRPSPGRLLLPFYLLLFFLVFSILYSNEIERLFHCWIHFKYLRLSISIHLVIRFD